MTAEIHRFPVPERRPKAGTLLPEIEWLRLELRGTLTRLHDQGPSFFEEACDAITGNWVDKSLEERLTCAEVYQILREVVWNSKTVDHAFAEIAEKVEKAVARGQIHPSVRSP